MGIIGSGKPQDPVEGERDRVYVCVIEAGATGPEVSLLNNTRVLRFRVDHLITALG